MSESGGSSASSSEEEEELESYRKGGYHAVRVGDHFHGGRYIAQRKLGWGHFSTVWLAYDVTSSRYVALKIQKSGAQFADAALHEIQFLSAIADHDSNSTSTSNSGSNFVMHLIDHFKHSGPNGHHLCIVLEFLGDSLLRLIRHNRYSPLPLPHVRRLCTCLLLALDYLHRHLRIIHCDLKPENILLLSTINPAKDPVASALPPLLQPPAPADSLSTTPNPLEKKLKNRRRRRRPPATQPSGRMLDHIDLRCKVVDFGNACWGGHGDTLNPFHHEIQTRQYRAPEIVLHCPYSYSVDMWSFACTAFELATGDIMFAPKAGQAFTEDEDHLALMMELLGKIPRKVLLASPRSKDFFDRYGDLKRIRRLKYWSLNKFLVDKYKFSETDAREFAEFLCPLLDFAPEKRPTAQQCLQHPWLNIRGPVEEPT